MAFGDVESCVAGGMKRGKWCRQAFCILLNINDKACERLVVLKCSSRMKFTGFWVATAAAAALT
jgi:hypothetical protein